MNTSQDEVEMPGDASGDEPALLTANVTITSLYAPDDRVLDTRTKMRGLVPGVVALVIGVTILILTTQVRDVANTPLGPRFWPGMIGWAIVALGIVLLVTFFVRGLRWGDVPAPITTWGVTRLLASAAILVGYLMLWEVVEFWMSTLVAVFTLILLYGTRSWKPLVIFPIAITALLHFLFVVALRVPL